jgi:hypothetical protein
MVVSSLIDDYDLIDDLDTLYFSVEIGESYERDKFKWTEKADLDLEKRKKLDFAFKMNHIKQTVSSVMSHSFFIDKSRNNRKLCQSQKSKRSILKDFM